MSTAIEWQSTRQESLLPQKIYEIADQKDNVMVTTERGEEDNLTLFAYEKNSPRMLTDERAWDAWMKLIDVARDKAAQGTPFEYPQPPEGIDRLHVLFVEKIRSGELTIHDRILFNCEVAVPSFRPEIMFVGYFEGEKNSGLATDFYLSTLPQLAKKIGVRFIIGNNNDKNVDFFINKLGRVPLTKIKPEFRDYFFPAIAADSSMMPNSTIQFIFPEDKKKYLLEE